MKNRNEESTTIKVNRIIYLDYMRVIATIAVMILHVSGQNWDAVDVNTLDWQAFHVYDSLVRWAVPVFIMISGAVFLGREHKIKNIFFKYILRLAVAFACWGCIYAIVMGGDKKQILLNAIQGHYHMWFIPMLIGLYVCIPIIQRIAESKEVTKYYLAVSFIVTFFIPQLVQFTNDFGGETLKEIIDAFNFNFAKMDFHIVLGYTCYFIGGFYLSKIELSKKSRCVIYTLGMVGAIATILLNAYLSIKLQKPVSNYYGHFTINVFLESLVIFVWIKYHCPNAKKLNVIIGKLSKYSFGAYLVHPLIIEQLDNLFGLNSLSFHPFVSVPIMCVIILVPSFTISWLIHQIPFLKKYIV